MTIKSSFRGIASGYEISKSSPTAPFPVEYRS
jgi:hypothetical protein